MMLGPGVEGVKALNIVTESETGDESLCAKLGISTLRKKPDGSVHEHDSQ